MFHLINLKIQIWATLKTCAVRFVPDYFVHFAGFEGEYPLIFNRKTCEMGGIRRGKDDGRSF